MQEGKVSRFSPLGHYYAPPLIIVIVIIIVVIIVIITRPKPAYGRQGLSHHHRHCHDHQLRLHLCWGNWHGPHHHDIPIDKIFKVAASTKIHCIANTQ